jgi:hypothetical protein
LIRDTPGVTSDVVERAIALWKRFVATDPLNLLSCRAFASWLRAHELPAEWRLSQLEGLLGRGVRPEPAVFVVQELAQFARAEPARTVRALHQLLELAREGWMFGAWRNDIVLIFQVGLESTRLRQRRRGRSQTDALGGLAIRECRPSNMGGTGAGCGDVLADRSFPTGAEECVIQTGRT